MGWSHFDPDEYEAVVESRPCSCRGKCDGRCNGMFGISQRRRSDAEIRKIKAERRRKEEDDILARAEQIKQSRKAKP